MSTRSLNRFSQHQFTQSTVELVVELVLVRRTYTKTGHLTLKFLLVAHDSFILNEVRRTMTTSILLFQSNEEDLLWKWEYANLLTFPRAWLWTALVCTFTHKYILRLSILRGFPKCWTNRKGDLVDSRLQWVGKWVGKWAFSARFPRATFHEVRAQVHETRLN